MEGMLRTANARSAGVVACLIYYVNYYKWKRSAFLLKEGGSKRQRFQGCGVLSGGSVPGWLPR
jgi:hypothetical protein